MKFLSVLCFAALSLFLASCSGSAFVSIPDVQQEFNLPSMPTAEQYPEDDAVVVLEDTDVQTTFDGSFSLQTNTTFHRILKLFRNIDGYASDEITVSHGEKLVSVAARTVRADGTVIDLKPEDFHTITGEGDGEVFYSDSKKIRFTFPAIEKGCLIEYKYTIYTAEPFITDVWQIQRTLPILRNRYSITVPSILMQKESLGGAGWTWRYKTYHYSMVTQPEVINYTLPGSMLDKKITFRWLLADVKPLEPEPSMPARSNFLGYVKFAPSEWENWNEVVSWYWKRYFSPQLRITDRVKSVADSLDAGCTSEQEKIARIFAYVQRMRYVAIELGEGGLRPSTPEQVMEREYGDCKDKSMLLVALLRAAQIDAKPVLVLTADNGTIDEFFPSWRFNHMIVRALPAGGKPVFLDGTSRYSRPGELSWQCEGIPVLTLSDDATGLIETTPTSTFTENTTSIDLHATLRTSGTSTFKVGFTYSGEEEDYYRWRFADESDKKMKEFCKSLIVDDFVNAKVIDYSVSPVDSLERTLQLQFTFEVEDAMQKQGDLYFASVDPFKFLTDMGWLIKETRKYPLTFRYPFTVKKTIDITLPDTSASIRSLPESGMIGDDYFSYHHRCSSDTPNHISASEVLTIKHPEIPPHRYVNERKLFEKAKAATAEKFVLSRH